MKKIIIGVVLVLLITAALFFITYNSASAPLNNNEEVSDGLPSGTPSNSAPSFSLEACVNKSEGDSCTMLTGKETVTGTCFTSGDQLACGPDDAKIIKQVN